VDLAKGKEVMCDFCDFYISGILVIPTGSSSSSMLKKKQ
jgi:hypothetical protein